MSDQQKRLSHHLLDRISSLYSGFTRSQKMIADQLLQDPAVMVNFSLAELSQHLQLGEATIIRFCHRLGFSGFSDFKLQFVIEQAVNRATNSTILDTDISPSESTSDVVHKLQGQLNDVIEETVNLIDLAIVEQVIREIKKAKRIFFFAVGGSGLTAEDAKHKFMRIGFQVDALTNSHFMYMQAALCKKDDLVFGISHSGNSLETCHALSIAGENGAAIVALTHHINSPITKLADFVLLNGGRRRQKEGDSISTKIAQLFVLDLLYTLVVRSEIEHTSLQRQKTIAVILEQQKNKMY